MPSKKLTKAQVRKELRTADLKLGRLLIDKATKEGSLVPMSVQKIIEIKTKIQQAEKRLSK
jgi:hypothetical protein